MSCCDASGLGVSVPTVPRRLRPTKVYAKGHSEDQTTEDHGANEAKTV